MCVTMGAIQLIIVYNTCVTMGAIQLIIVYNTCVTMGAIQLIIVYQNSPNNNDDNLFNVCVNLKCIRN